MTLSRDVLARLDQAIDLSEKIPCVGNCQVDLMDSNINADGVCQGCRAHWLLETTHSAFAHLNRSVADKEQATDRERALDAIRERYLQDVEERLLSLRHWLEGERLHWCSFRDRDVAERDVTQLERMVEEYDRTFDSDYILPENP